MSRLFFVAGTDTEVGKTFVGAALLTRAERQGLKTAAYKPVASGADETPDGLRNGDATTLLSAMNCPMPYEWVNPCCFRPAIAPHIAAREAGIALGVDMLVAGWRPLEGCAADFYLIEGAGGWRTPLNDRETLADFAQVLGAPVILVVAMRLGCINHALLTAEAVKRDGLELAGWVANQPGPQAMDRYGENLQTLRMRLSAPLLGELSFVEDGDFRRAADFLRLPDEFEPG